MPSDTYNAAAVSIPVLVEDTAVAVTAVSPAPLYKYALPSAPDTVIEPAAIFTSKQFLLPLVVADIAVLVDPSVEYNIDAVSIHVISSVAAVAVTAVSPAPLYKYALPSALVIPPAAIFTSKHFLLPLVVEVNDVLVVPSVVYNAAAVSIPVLVDDTDEDVILVPLPSLS